ncbi:2034_t:CDS:2 [Entrophospora sp. SA101]|nr:2034_t:CDS:2 [Entrophospora sp. SA101]
MSIFFGRHSPILIAAVVGVASGLYIWIPIFEQYKRENLTQPSTSSTSRNEIEVEESNLKGKK